MNEGGSEREKAEWGKTLGRTTTSLGDEGLGFLSFLEEVLL